MRSIISIATTFIGILLSANSSFAFDHSYLKWAEVLSKFTVVNGPVTKVKYLELKENSAALDHFLKEVPVVTINEYNGWNSSQKLAFLFNSYNAFTIKHILNNHSKEKPLKSIKDIGSIFKNSWKIKFFQFLGSESSLDRIEHELARPNFDDPRMHMAFNCASKGCPALLSTPFVADRLDAQLDQAAKLFLSDSKRNIYDAKSDSLQVSAIFKWYKDDFEKSSKTKSLKNFLLTYMDLTPAVKEKLIKTDLKLKYLDYDWTLNTAD